MSGHSKWSQIKHKKAATDGQKSRLFGQLAREIVVAARHGTDPTANASLREAIARARKANMPQENIVRLISSHADAGQEEILYEGFGPAGVSLLIGARTDNQNRTVSELRTLLKGHGGTLGTSNSVRWKFSSSFDKGAVRYIVRPDLVLAVPEESREAVQGLLAVLRAHPDIVRVDTDLADK